MLPVLMHESEREEQVLELEVLQAIFGSDELTVLDEDPIKLELLIPLHLGCARRVHADIRPLPPLSADAGVSDIGATGETSSSEPATRTVAESAQTCFVPAAVVRAQRLLERRGLAPESPDRSVFVRHVPPLQLVVTFCPGYPSKCPMDFRISSQWLSQAQLTALCIALDGLAGEMQGEQLVFAMAEWLQENALVHLSLDGETPLVLEPSLAACDRRAVSSLVHSNDASQALIEFDAERDSWLWQQGAHFCEICLAKKPGVLFTKLTACAHGFCTQCLSDMLGVHIADGSVGAIRCPKSDCRAEVGMGIVQRLVDDVTFQRWYRLQVQRTLNEMPSVVYCPACERCGAETPVLPEPAADPLELPFARCDRCGFPFCAACREVYHPDSRCIAQEGRLAKLGISASMAGSSAKVRRERLQQELASLKVIQAEAVQCPTCKTPICRSYGCNHMECTKCGTHFCYRCGADISERKYDHFRADRCPTFDREEVQRMQNDNFGLEDELANLRRQYPDQMNIVLQWQGAADVQRRTRKVADVQCPNCRNFNSRVGTNNHVRCRICRTNSCASCRKAILGVITKHFHRGGCPQHSD